MLVEGVNVSLSGSKPLENSLPDATSWRRHLKSDLAIIIAPDEVSWMEDELPSTDSEYALRALCDIKERFSRPMTDDSVTGRLVIVEQLGSFACLIAHAGVQPCNLGAGAPNVSSLDTYFDLAPLLLKGLEPRDAAKVRARFCDLLKLSIRHHPLDPTDSSLKRVTRLILNYMDDTERSVRLAAGRALVEVCRVYQAAGLSNSKDVDGIFAALSQMLDNGKEHTKESIAISVGVLGRVVERSLLGRVLSLLISLLGRQNPVLKGTAYTQLQVLAKCHNTTQYKLVAPYQSRIAPMLVSRICTDPSLIVETCRFLLTTPGSLIASTLAFTLPPIFAKGDLRVLEKVGEATGRKPSSLFLGDLQHSILAYIYLLRGPVQTNRALEFVLRVLKDAAGGETINLRDVVKSCSMQLIAELVVVLGDADPDRAESAVEALQKVGQTLETLKPSRRQDEPQTIGDLLRDNMLGIISYMNDLLQDVQGKKSTTTKQGVLRALGAFISYVGPAISSIAPQIMATLQTSILVRVLAESTIDSWRIFIHTLAPQDLGPHVGPTSAAVVAVWATLSESARTTAAQCLSYIVLDVGEQIGDHLDDMVDLRMLPELEHVHNSLAAWRSRLTPSDRLAHIIQRSSSENLTVALQSLHELRVFMLEHEPDFCGKLASGDMFDPLVGQLMTALMSAASRDGEDVEELHLLAYECIGALGALDPDRVDVGTGETTMIVLNNFADEDESVLFAIHLIQDVLVGAFRSTSEIQYQSLLGYAIQELLQFCKFNTTLVTPGHSSSVSLKTRKAWSSLPKHVVETVTPLLGARFTLKNKVLPDMPHPIYPSQTTYREWIQLWTAYLITRCSGQRAETIFGVFRAVVRNKDVGVARQLLPHLVLNIIISGDHVEADKIRLEMIAVLEDQVKADNTSTPEKKLLSAQTVFMLMDHLNKWVRHVRQDVSKTKADSRRSRTSNMTSEAEEQLLRVDSILSTIDQDLMGQAALQCKAYALALMNFEKRIVTLQQRSSDSNLQEYYERLHQIYSHLEEPDGMEGISTLIISPSLEHQIRQHESTGRWTSAQSCWEVRLQQSPDNLDFHLGLMRCLRNLGHYDTLRTHVKGVLTRNPGWQSELADFQAESSWMVGDWTDIQALLDGTSSTRTASVSLARVLLSMQSEDEEEVSRALSDARMSLGHSITAAGANSYRRSYDAVINLHLLHELDIFSQVVRRLSPSHQGDVQTPDVFTELSRTFDARLESTLPNFRTREPILSLRRTAMRFLTSTSTSHREVSRSWLTTAKNARKAGHWQTAYSAILQAQQQKGTFPFIESARLLRATGEPLRALQELEHSMRANGFLGDDVIDVEEEEDDRLIRAKAMVLRARWLNESDRFDFSLVLDAFQKAVKVSQEWESGYFHLGRFYDECYKRLSESDKVRRGIRMAVQTVKNFIKAIRFGSKFVYQAVPRLLTLWLDTGEDPNTKDTEWFDKIIRDVSSSLKHIPVYKWYTAFPQIVSRVGHSNDSVYVLLSKLIALVIQEYPRQALWLFAAVVKSTKEIRRQRGQDILNRLRNNPKNHQSVVPLLINESVSMTHELLRLCDFKLKDDKKILSMRRDFPRLYNLAPSRLIIPLQESLTASLPPTSLSSADHQPFPVNTPAFQEFHDEIEVMRSLAKPRKISILGDNGTTYMFLGKPKDDLRKDARLMDFNSIINKLLKSNSESRRRQLHIRTYGVVTLNEECGFIQWVPNTIPLRAVLVKYYDARGVRSWNNEMGQSFARIKDAKDKEAAQIFAQEVIPQFPPVFHEWFLETFPEPSAWLASRLTYGRTAAVMSMVGFILGLGDRHCENILLDSNTGDIVHVDFNCLFEKGKTLDTPERVPFRLTHNLVDGLGVTGVEGVFRIAAEATMQLLRDNKDTLMSVLDAFIHDPLVEWEDESRKRASNHVRSSTDLRQLAKSSLYPIEKKLKGIYATNKERERSEREVSTSNLVQMLIQESTDLANLAKMYPGWAPWH
ncbi:hypothetical protein PUNSTDRAFT_63830 [Punctularia strigosozonata HHB-11173 SS5]|uniref:uncharacterized protein n=1 Tax=Punctularia strigosozonata (strain HHB-11173) TaxID=741275 RepID=UPI0004418677|nr:uncharacterized protein PUNSTDRAFT_63830 [Punctularia strigosozonata HHB-11173 SS5]EIN10974.1 hypothetical protein PUNSTDRAFT_63830 [Punctularia strigosozonata HHB-11173 SS5]